jgi:DNA polymerase-3 subunit beta
MPLQDTVIKSFTWIIPSKTASQIRSIINENDDIKIISWENQIAFLFWNTKLYSRLLNWKFPDYTNFFPKSYTTKSEINKVDLISALKKINLISRENNYSIKMSFSKESWIFLETSETQIWESDITLIWTIEWDDNIIWINSVYFLEVLWVIETTHISISFETPLSPILITPIKDPETKEDDSFRHIIMPLKI